MQQPTEKPLKVGTDRLGIEANLAPHKIEMLSKTNE